MPNNNVNNLGPVVLLITLVIIGLVIFIIYIVAWWKIFSKAGYSGALSLLLIFVPIANIIVFLILAFGTWPIQRELDQLRQQVARGQQYQSPQYPPYPQR
jgi:heme/copper-type cytochrome/quinol oxidase subunit 2